MKQLCNKKIKQKKHVFIIAFWKEPLLSRRFTADLRNLKVEFSNYAAHGKSGCAKFSLAFPVRER